MKKICLGSIALVSSLFGLEFGGMGNISAGMGGAGVALKNSQWAIYYNPALLAVNKKSGFAYSFGVGYKETNLSAIAGIDFNNLEQMPNKINGLFNGTTTRSVGTTRVRRSTGAKATPLVGGAMGDVLANLVGKTNGSATDDDLKTYIGTVAKNNNITVDTSKGVDEIVQDIQKNPQGNAAFDEIKQGLQASIDKTKAQNPNDESLGLLGTIVDNLTPENVGGLLEIAGKGNGNMDLGVILSKMGGITLSTSSDPSLNQFLKDVGIINDVLHRNDFSIATQNGLVINIGSKNTKRGTISVAIMPSAFVSATARIDNTHNRIIIDAGSSNYAEVSVGSGSVTIKKSDKATFDSSSLLSDQANHALNVSSVTIAEVPVGYGHLFETKIGNFAVGGAVKYIFGLGYAMNAQGGFNNLTSNINVNAKDIQQTRTFGIDLGFLYQPRFTKNFSIGLVAKNLNAPKIKTNMQRVTLNPQVRAGLSYTFLSDKIVLALDADLLPNDTLSIARPKSQVVGGGLLFDFKWVDLRLGSMYDFRNNSNEGMILTAGINILGFLDVAVQSNLHMASFEGISLPSYFNVKLGGSFSW
ncbi:conjugal transfer protein TraF [uncultured Helicobacter sp.]|uniref:conjugal transfer protein TraF n=1 Tax=uncultured Helicobacter sp. TaxID=175537 RepID=UPI00258B397A|nr:conjugal transfer protein TraF [uncultured Helicobacter sp.]